MSDDRVNAFPVLAEAKQGMSALCSLCDGGSRGTEGE